MRVLIDIPSMICGGAERQAILLASGLAARGDAALLVVNKRVNYYGGEIVARGIDVLELGRESRFDARLLADLVQQVNAFRPDVILCVMFNATFWGRLAAMATGTPVVVAEHSSHSYRFGVIALSNRLLAPFTSAVVACADRQKRSVIASGHRSSQVRVVHNGIDVDAFVRSEESRRAIRAELSIPSGSLLVGLVAGHRREKRHDRFIAVIEKLCAEGTDAWGLMVGDGPLFESNARALHQSGVADRISILGARTDLDAIYSACDAVALVSDSVEAFPLCLLEAQACAVPVVAMDVGGVSETFRDGKTGFLVRAGDVEGVTSALRTLAANVELRARMGAEARRFVETEFTIDRMAAQYAEVFRSVAGIRA